MERAVEITASLCFLVVGLSHVLQPRAWVDFFVLLRSKGEAGVLIDGFLYLPFAALIIGFHDVWSGVPLLLTLLGWGFLIKSVLRFCVPRQGLRMLGRVSPERAWEFRVPGVAYVLIGALLGGSALGWWA